MAIGTIRSAWRRFAALWRPMAAWSVLTWATVTLPLAPLSSYVLGWSALRGNRPVVGNEELLAWGATLPGVAWGLLAGAFAIMAAVVQFAGIFHILTDDLEGRDASLRQTALDLAPRLPALFRLCMATVAGAAILAIPTLAGLAVIKATVLGSLDINYYLAERPREWYAALALAGAWLVVVGGPALYLLGRSVLALPAYLDGHEPLRTALAESWSRTRGEAAPLVRTLGLALGSWALARTAVDAAWLAVGSAAVGAIGGITDSLTPLVIATGGYLLGLGILDTVVAFTGFAFVATVLTRAYHEDTDLHAAAPPAPALQELPGRAVRALQALLRPRVGIPVAGTVVLLSALASGWVIGRMPDPGPVIVTAHRAGPPPAPENTLAALERAIQADADWAEIDVQRTRDGRVVVAHDADLMRMAGDPRRIRTTPYAELRDVVQQPDDGSPPAERRVATLDEFLERSQDRIGLLIELKYYGPDPELADAVVRTVRRAGMSAEVRVMSLDYGAVRDVERLAPRISTGFVAAAAVGNLGRLPMEFVAVSRSRVTTELIRTANRQGREVHAWTVNSAAEMADLIERGVHGIITDRPALARRVSREMRELSPAARLLLRFRDLWDEETPPATPSHDVREGG